MLVIIVYQSQGSTIYISIAYPIHTYRKGDQIFWTPTCIQPGDT